MLLWWLLLVLTLWVSLFSGLCDVQNFITMATPHLGIRRPQRGSINFLFNSVTPKLFHR
jgi:hypothetical protein